MSYQWSKEVSAFLRIRRRALRCTDDWKLLQKGLLSKTNARELERDWLNVLKEFNSLFEITDDPVRDQKQVSDHLVNTLNSLGKRIGATRSARMLES